MSKGDYGRKVIIMTGKFKNNMGIIEGYLSSMNMYIVKFSNDETHIYKPCELEYI